MYSSSSTNMLRYIKTALSSQHNRIFYRHVSKIFNLEFTAKCPAFVHIPEMPDFTKEENFDRVEDLRADVIFKRFSRELLHYDAQCDRIISKYTSNNASDCQHVLLKEIQKELIPPVTTLYACDVAVAQNADEAMSIVNSSLHAKLKTERDERFKDKKLYDLICSAARDTSDLNEFEKGAVKHYMLQFTKSEPSVILDSKSYDKIVDFTRFLKSEKNEFTKCSWICSTRFRFPIKDVEIGMQLPDQLRRIIAVTPDAVDTGPWVMHLDYGSSTYQQFMGTCPDRAMRWNCWRAMVRRAGQDFVSEHYSNGRRVDVIRRYRRNIAESMGYKNHVERALQGSMAGTLENVFQMIDANRLRYKEVAVKETEELLEFAREHGFEDKSLKQWDLLYWSTQFNSKRFFDNFSSLEEAFPRDNVLKAIFQITEELFGVEVVANEYSPDEFQFVEDGAVVGSFIVDRGMRPEKLKFTPANAAAFPLLPSSADRPARSYLLINCDEYLNWFDVKHLLESWGDLLQQTLTRVEDIPELSGQAGLPSDAKKICPLVLRTLLLTETSFLKRLTTGVPDDVVSQLAQFRSKTNALFLMEKLFIAAFDLDMWMNEEHWRDVMRSLWPEFMPIELDHHDEWPASNVEIFARDGDVKQYSEIWARTIAADVVAAFTEKGVTSIDAQQVGRRFRDTFLGLGGAVPAAEVFRRFRGRDPVKDADILID